MNGLLSSQLTTHRVQMVTGFFLCTFRLVWNDVRATNVCVCLVSMRKLNKKNVYVITHFPQKLYCVPVAEGEKNTHISHAQRNKQFSPSISVSSVFNYKYIYLFFFYRRRDRDREKNRDLFARNRPISSLSFVCTWSECEKIILANFDFSFRKKTSNPHAECVIA